MRRFVLTILALASFLTAVQAGSVRCGDVKLAGVIVTDGENFTRTTKNGRFTFEINDDAEFVYLVTPAGYVAEWQSGVPAFYKPAAGVSKFEFNLQRTGGGSDYHIVAIADPQAYSDEHFAEFSGEPMADLCRTAKGLSGVTVGLSLGDISWDRIEVLDMYKKEIVRTGIPFYPVIGNHDHEAYAQGDIETAAGYRSKMGPENYAKQVEKQVIEVAPLAYMRGRTLDDSFIILDEAQNATPEQMKMFLTRLGFRSKAVVTGDLTQTDLPTGQKSGLAMAVKILEGIDDIYIHRFSDKDVVRHKLVQKIILAYERYDRERQQKPRGKEASK